MVIEAKNLEDVRTAIHLAQIPFDICFVDGDMKIANAVCKILTNYIPQTVNVIYNASTNFELDEEIRASQARIPRAI